MLFNPAIGVNHYDDTGRVTVEVPKTVIQRISLADAFGVMTVDNLGT